jgi:hypothetical protein
VKQIVVLAVKPGTTVTVFVQENFLNYHLVLTQTVPNSAVTQVTVISTGPHSLLVSAKAIPLPDLNAVKTQNHVYKTNHRYGNTH